MSKRKVENRVQGLAKQRRRPRGVPLQKQTKEPEKREVLKRLFGRYCAVNIQNNHQENSEDEDYDELDENEDPLLDDVPVNMDPEQLGFLMCAQETLRFLYGRGFTAEDPMFMRLRSRFLQGINDIAAA